MASWLAGNHVLYCGPECAMEDGEREGRYIRAEQYDQKEHGALCPVCEREYDEF